MRFVSPITALGTDRLFIRVRALYRKTAAPTIRAPARM